MVKTDLCESMRVPLLIIAILPVGLALFQTYLSGTGNKTNVQSYNLIRLGGDYEIRYYPSAMMATIQSSEKSYKALSRAGFGKLANFIFGNNSRKQKIAMTTPVHLQVNADSSSICFVMPSMYNKENIPQPIDPKVLITYSPNEYVAAVKFSGFANDEKINYYIKILKQSLKENSITYTGDFSFLGYSPPYQLFDRKNEVIVNINWH
jgi:hypothetical protein